MPFHIDFEKADILKLERIKGREGHLNGINRYIQSSKASLPVGLRNVKLCDPSRVRECNIVDCQISNAAGGQTLSQTGLGFKCHDLACRSCEPVGIGADICAGVHGYLSSRDHVREC